MKINLKKQDIYIPEWNDNLELPEQDQIKVLFNILTTEDRNNFVVYSKSKTIASIAKEVFLKAVQRIDNLEVTVDGVDMKPTPEQIMELPDLYELFTEISTAIITKSSLQEDDKKKL